MMIRHIRSIHVIYDLFHLIFKTGILFCFDRRASYPSCASASCWVRPTGWEHDGPPISVNKTDIQSPPPGSFVSDTQKKIHKQLHSFLYPWAINSPLSSR